MDLSGLDPHFNPVAVGITVVLLLYAVAFEPLWGRREFARLRATRDTDPGVLVRMYRLSVGAHWVWSVLVVVAVLVAPGVGAADVGVTAPKGSGFAYGLAAAVVAGLGVSVVMIRNAVRKGQELPGQEAIGALLPRTGRERGYAGIVAVSAGVCEELLYRGLFIAAGVGIFGLPMWVAAVLSGVIFLVAHIYQGMPALVAVAAVTVLLTVLYVASGSLLLPIIVHILIDVRGLLLVPAPVRSVPDAPSV